MLTAASRSADFPALVGQAYLNTAAECIPPRATLDAVRAYLDDKCAGMNGRDAHFARAEACRRVAARLVGMEPAEVAFCSCSSEAYNLLAQGVRPEAGDEIVVSDLDFPAGSPPGSSSRGGPTCGCGVPAAGRSRSTTSRRCSPRGRGSCRCRS